MRRLLIVLLLVMFSAPLAQAQTKKYQPRQDVVKLLENRFKEKVIGMGLASNGAIMEFFVKEDGQTWTILFTMPNGLSFIGATGQSWDTQSIPKGELY